MAARNPRDRFAKICSTLVGAAVAGGYVWWQWHGTGQVGSYGWMGVFLAGYTVPYLVLTAVGLRRERYAARSASTTSQANAGAASTTSRGS